MEYLVTELTASIDKQAGDNGNFWIKDSISILHRILI